MDTKIFENLREYNSNALNAVKELETMNTRIFEQISAKQMELINTAFETGTRYLNSLGEAKGYQEFLSEQTKLASDFNEKVIETARSTADILAASREDYQNWIEKSMKSLTLTDFTIPGFGVDTKKASAKKAA